MGNRSSSRAGARTTKISLAILVVAGCAGHHRGNSISAKGGHGADVVSHEATLATVLAVDRENRVLIMKEADGDLATVAVGDDVVLGRIEVGDLVRIHCQDSLAFELLEPGKSVDEGQEYTRKDLPEGVLFGRRISTTVEILSIAAAGKITTFRSHDGAVHKVDVEAESNRMRLAQLRPGDDVEVVFTEKLGVRLAR